MTLYDNGFYKFEISKAFTKFNDIGELMLGNEYDQETAEEQLMYQNIFPYLYIEGTQTVEKAYLCVEVDNPRIPNGNIKEMEITVLAYCHKGIMKYSKYGYAGTRADILADMAFRAISTYANNLGIKQIRLKRNKFAIPGDNFYGKELTLTCPEFARR